MTLKTVPVTGTLYNADGSVAASASVVATLTAVDTDAGVVVPSQVSTATDSSGNFTLNLWPNSRGVNGSQYTVRAQMPGALPGVLLMNLRITVPDSNPAVAIPIATITNRTAPSALSDSKAAMLAAQGFALQAQAVISDSGFLAVKENLANIATVAQGQANIDAVVPHLVNVDALADGIERVDAVAADLAHVDAVAADLPNVDTVAQNIGAVDAAAQNIELIQSAPVNAQAAQDAQAQSEANMLTAVAQASLAASYAASAGSVVAQDLSGVTAAALHRSPNAVTAQFIYDTRYDDDGGAWVDKVGHLSYSNETLQGTWLGWCADETAARAVSGAGTGAYFGKPGDGKFYRLNADAGVTEVFRGNQAKPPRIWGIVAEASRLIPFGLDLVGRPMWISFATNGAATNVFQSATPNITCVFVINGKLAVGTNGQGLFVFDFANDVAWNWRTTGLWRANAPLSARNTSNGLTLVDATKSIASNVVNAVAMTVRPNAPVDPVTGLRVPTIGVAVGTGNAGQVGSVIMDDGSVVNYSTPSNDGTYVGFTSRGDVIWGFSQASVGCVMPLATTSQTNIASSPAATTRFYGNGMTATQLAGFGPQTGKRPVPCGLTGLAMIAAGQGTNALHRIRENPSNGLQSLAAHITDIYTTGWLPGDTRRALGNDSVVGAASGAELVANGGFATGDMTGWTLLVNGGTASVSGGVATLTSDGTDRIVYSQPLAVTPGRTYRVRAAQGGTSPALRIGNSNNFASFEYVSSSAASVAATFVPTQPTIYVMIGTVAGTQGATGTFGGITVQECIVDRSYKGAAVDVHGVITRTQVANAAQLTCLGGFSATTYLQEAAHSADLDFGTGAWCVAAKVNVPATGFGPANFIRNSTMQGAVTGTPGTVPTNWTWSFKNGLSGNIAGVGVEDGYEYFDLRISGTTTASSTWWLYVDGSGAIATAPGQAWAGGIRVKLQAGAIPGSAISLGVEERSSANDFLQNSPGSVVFSPDGTSLGGQPIRAITTTTANASAAKQNLLLTTNHAIPNATVVDFTLRIAAPQMNRGASLAPYTKTTGTAYNGIAPIYNYAASTGQYVTVGIDGNGMWAAEAYDGTTTRRVTSAAPGNTGTWQEVMADYATSGSLSLTVNGRPSAATTGAPLLTLTNANAVATYGQNFGLTAPFPGQFCLLKVGATTPSADAAPWIYEQEKELLRDGAQCMLPDSGALVDLAYDRARDLVKVVSASNESSFTGLNRISTAPVSAGSFSDAVVESGIKMLARTGTNPGVDITIPAWNLREELYRRAEDANRVSRKVETFDWTGSFTASTTTGQNTLTSVAGLVLPQGATIVGSQVSGAGISAGTTVLAVSGTTVYLSAPATATASGVPVSLFDFVLPVGYEARDAFAAGGLKREGTGYDYLRKFDGFRERVSFNTSAPGNVHVRLGARRMT